MDADEGVHLQKDGPTMAKKGEGVKEGDSGQRARVIETADDEQTTKGKRKGRRTWCSPAITLTPLSTI